MTNGMRRRAKKVRQKVDERLAEVENKLLSETTLNWDEIRPELEDKAEYDRLMKIVNESTQRNESIGQFMNRLKALGSGGAKLLSKVKTFILA